MKWSSLQVGILKHFSLCAILLQTSCLVLLGDRNTQAPASPPLGVQYPLDDPAASTTAFCPREDQVASPPSGSRPNFPPVGIVTSSDLLRAIFIGLQLSGRPPHPPLCPDNAEAEAGQSSPDALRHLLRPCAPPHRQHCPIPSSASSNSPFSSTTASGRAHPPPLGRKADSLSSRPDSGCYHGSPHVEVGNALVLSFSLYLRLRPATEGVG
ncbi:unnamed protein product [Protopolystoma xenopodis]|uniref:Uncharacterized protein n=1 Tax=Protopolystoma xenopodis TaxID=117903 RepID=A0A3S5C651_9PLAT|nr:unnamed protein product [Protopolystoma xenopodis]